MYYHSQAFSKSFKIFGTLEWDKNLSSEDKDEICSTFSWLASRRFFNKWDQAYKWKLDYWVECKKKMKICGEISEIFKIIGLFVQQKLNQVRNILEKVTMILVTEFIKSVPHFDLIFKNFIFLLQKFWFPSQFDFLE